MPGGMKKGKTEAPRGGSLEKTPPRLKRERNKRKSEEARPTRLNGPVSGRKQDEDLGDSK